MVNTNQMNRERFMQEWIISNGINYRKASDTFDAIKTYCEDKELEQLQDVMNIKAER